MQSKKKALKEQKRHENQKIHVQQKIKFASEQTSELMNLRFATCDLHLLSHWLSASRTKKEKNQNQNLFFVPPIHRQYI